MPFDHHFFTYRYPQKPKDKRAEQLANRKKAWKKGQRKCRPQR